MDLNELAKLLAAYKSGELETNEAVDRIKNLHFEDIGFARVDHSRASRQGFPEVVFGGGKTRAQIVGIVERLVERSPNILVTRTDEGTFGEIRNVVTDAEWHEALDQTLFPAIRASRLAVPHMKQRGGGAIIMIASIFGREAGGRMTYNAVKAAEISLAKALSQQLAPANIRVNSVAPGSIMFAGGSWHRRQQTDPSGIADMIKRELPFGRFGRADEVGTVVAFLASPRASWISGASIVVDGCQSRSNI